MHTLLLKLFHITPRSMTLWSWPHSKIIHFRHCCHRGHQCLTKTLFALAFDPFFDFYQKNTWKIRCIKNLYLAEILYTARLHLYTCKCTFLDLRSIDSFQLYRWMPDELVRYPIVQLASQPSLNNFLLLLLLINHRNWRFHKQAMLEVSDPKYVELVYVIYVTGLMLLQRSQVGWVALLMTKKNKQHNAIVRWN